MIISHIIGGLGNQLFQFAAGKCLAELRSTSLKLDTSSFSSYSLRNFDLSRIVQNLAIADPSEVHNLLPKNTIQKISQRLKPLNARTYYREKYYHHDPQFFKLGDNVYLKGYFQSEKYFLPIKELLKQQIAFPSEIKSQLSDIAAKMRSSNSCAVHLRRGDVSTDKSTQIYHGNLPMDHYHFALKQLNEIAGDVDYYLFSDDMQWARQNFVLPADRYISSIVTKDHFGDLYLMSQCRHNIIANSSFSWWGAWLNEHADKIVIAPKNWFNEGPKDTEDLLPERWIRI